MVKRKILSAVLATGMVLNCISAMAEENGSSKFTTFNMREVGANAIMFGTEDLVKTLSDDMKAGEETQGGAYSETDNYRIKNYLYSKKAVGSDRPVKLDAVLQKGTVDEEKDENGYIYAWNYNDGVKDGASAIPFDVTTDVDQPNGIIIGYPNKTEQTLTLYETENSAEYLDKLYVVINSTNFNQADVKVVYYDDSESNVVMKWEYPNYNNVTGIWTNKLKWKYRIEYDSSGLIKEKATETEPAKYYDYDADRHMNVATIDLDVGKKVKSVSFKKENDYGWGAIMGITGEKADMTDVINSLTAKLPDNVTAENARETMELLAEIKAITGWESMVTADDKTKMDTLGQELLKLDAEYVTFNLRAAGAGAKIFADSSTVETLANTLSQLSSDTAVADEIKNNYPIKSVASGKQPRISFVANKTAFDNIKNASEDKYIYDKDNKIPFDISTDLDAGNGFIAGGQYADPVININATDCLDKLYLYHICDLSGTATVTLKYNDGEDEVKSISYYAPTYGTSSVITSSLWGQEFSSAYYTFSYNSDASYKSNSLDTTHPYANIMEIPVDGDRLLKSVSVDVSNSGYSMAILGVTGLTQTTYETINALYNKLDSLTISTTTYEKALALISGIEGHKDYELCLNETQLETLAEKKTQAAFYVKLNEQSYIPFDISAGANGRVFVKEGSLVADVKGCDMSSVNGSANTILNKAAFDAKKTDGYIYADNGIPFDVNTDGYYGEGSDNSKKSGYVVGPTAYGYPSNEITIDIPDGNYDSISVLAYAGYVLNQGQFSIEAVYQDGSASEKLFGLSSATYNNTFNVAENTKRNADSKLNFAANENSTLRNNVDATKYTAFATLYNFPVLTLDTDVERTITGIKVKNNSSNVGAVVLGVTGSESDSIEKTLTKLTNTANEQFTANEITAGFKYMNELVEKGIKSWTGYERILTLKAEAENAEVKLQNVTVENGIVNSDVEVYSAAEKEYTVIYAVYSGNEKLERVYIAVKDIKSSAGSYKLDSVNAELSEGEYIKCFIWNDMKPYAESITK